MELNINQLIEQCENKGCVAIEMLKNVNIQANIRITTLETKLDEKDTKIKELETKLSINSSNSSKPPSTDGFKRNNTSSLREKSDKKSGGQEGHQGNTLNMIENPDEIVPLKVLKCSCCGEDLSEIAETSIEKRQVFDIPPIKMNITEYQAASKTCLHCNNVTKASFPDGVLNKTQYGQNIKSLMIYFNTQQLIPLDRTTEIFEEVFNVTISEGTIVNTTNSLFEKLESFETAIKEVLIESPIIHKDETGIFVEDKLSWLHSTSTEKLTHYHIHPKRGSIAMEADKILPLFKGIAVHDFWKPYYLYENMNHALCNAHHLRELKSVFENTQQKWSMSLSSLLKSINSAIYKEKDMGQTSLSSEALDSFDKKYDELISEGFSLNPFVEKEIIKQGKPKQSKAHNLLKRLSEHKTEALRFMNNFEVPFTNNLAERDIRMTKLKQKISGTFRSLQGAKSFCRIRAYTSTVRKNAVSVLEEIQKAFLGHSFVPKLV